MPIASLQQDELDFVIDAPLFAAGNLNVPHFIAEPYVCEMNENAVIADKRVTLKTYLDRRHLHVYSRRNGRGQADNALNKLGHQDMLRCEFSIT